MDTSTQSEREQVEALLKLSEDELLAMLYDAGVRPSLRRDKVDHLLSQGVKDALAIFTQEERDGLRATYSYETGQFIGIGFIDPTDDQYTKYADSEKAAALSLLEVEYCKALLEKVTPLP